MKFVVSALTLGVASATICPIISQKAYNDDTCTDAQNSYYTYMPRVGCEKFDDQLKNSRNLWVMSGGSNDWARYSPGALIHDCTSDGHNVRFYDDTSCDKLVSQHIIYWGPKNTCVKNGIASIWLTEVVNEEWIQEQERKQQEKDDTPEHWKAVEKACKYQKNLEPECIDAFYHALDMDNGAEWLISLGMWFNNQPWIALFGLPISWFASLCGWYFLFFPDRLPHISDAPWENVKPVRGLMIQAVTLTAQMIKPDAFFFTQMFTFGQSNLRDLELIYMDPFDAVIYFFLESFILPQMSIVSLLWVSVFWWLYLAEFTWWIVERIFEIFIAGDDEQYYDDYQ